MRLIPILGGIAVSGGIATAVLAHSGAAGVVKQRMDAMEAIATATKALAGISARKTAYDPQTIRSHAMTLQMHSGQSLTRLFPKDSISGPSEASPEIWANWQDFSASAARLEKLATGLGLAADNGFATVRRSIGRGATVEQIGARKVNTVFAAIADTCKSCHARFRVAK
jgi:cytochrome c556